MDDKPKKSSFSEGIFDEVEEKPASQEKAAVEEKKEQQAAESPVEEKPIAAPAMQTAAPVSHQRERPGPRGRRSTTPRRNAAQSQPDVPKSSEHSEASEEIIDVSPPRTQRARGTKQSSSTAVTAAKTKGVRKRMLINALEPEETRIAVLENDTLEELYIERTSADSNVGNIYQGRVTNVEPGIQAAFIDIGLSRNGFLHVSDLVAAETDDSDESDEDGTRTRRSRRPRLPIQQILHRGDKIIVQVTRAGIGAKGPSLTTHISLPGRYMVLMPMDKVHGVSRKITDEKVRQRLRKTVADLAGMVKHGFIIRTAGATASKRDLVRDLRYVERLWTDIEARADKVNPPAILYTESDLVLRCLRDVLTPDTEEIIIDSEEQAKKVREFLHRFSRSTRTHLRLYTGREPLFHKYHLEEQIELIHQSRIPLSHGGSIVIQQTEAMVAIDVNSGRFIDESDPEETAYKTNMEAAPEIARQLRLRDLGGVIVIDFIDMTQVRHRRDVERALAQAMKRDRARYTALRMSRFCLVEMTRQRVRTSLERTAFETCPTCSGRGIIKSIESVALDAMRKIKCGAHRERVEQVEAIVHPNVAWYLLNKKRKDLAALETQTQRIVSVTADATKGLESSDVICHLDDGRKSRL